MGPYQRIYNYEGAVHRLTGSQKFHQQMETDPNFSLMIMKRIKEKSLDDTHAFIMEAEQSSDVEEKNERKNDERPQASGSQEFIDKWENEAIKLLLDEYHKRITKFRDPTVKKIQLFVEISGVLKKYHYNFSPKAIHSKIRNLKATYIKVKNNNKRSGAGRKSWPWLEQMDAIYRNDESVNFNNHQFIESSSMKASVEITPNTDVEESSEDEECDGEKEPATKKIKAKKVLYHQRKKQLTNEDEKLRILSKLTSVIESYQQESARKTELYQEALSQFIESVNARTEALTDFMKNCKK